LVGGPVDALGTEDVHVIEFGALLGPEGFGRAETHIHRLGGARSGDEMRRRDRAS
jgi:hypothetical protein